MYARYTALPHSLKSGMMVWLLIALLLSACAPAVPAADGEVLHLFQGAADWVIADCVYGECGTQIWTREGMTVYARPLLDGFAFTGEARSTVTGMVQKMDGGNLVNWRTWEDFRAWMLAEGWTVANMRLVISNLPAIIRSTFTIIVLPVSVDLPTFPMGGECDTVDGICGWTEQP